MDKIIITIRDQNKRFNSYDLELPTAVPIHQLKKDIIETLNSYKKSLFLSDQKVVLTSPRLRRSLADYETLDMAGIWNGDYIDFTN